MTTVNPERPRQILRRVQVGGVAAAILLVIASLQPATAAESSPGATVDELLSLVRRFNPEIAARVIDTEAATAKASAAGSLDDPMVRITSDEVDRTSGGRINKMIYSVEQEFPLWGKRDLRRRIAEAEANGVRARERATTLELEARVKTVFAQYYRAARSLEVEHDIHTLLHAVARTAETRYSQGVGNQSDAIRAGVERSRLELELVTLEREKSTARGRLNALLARPPVAPLAEPVALRAVPHAKVLRIEALLDRARMDSPVLATASAEIVAAEGGRTLVDKSWYPDVSVGASAIDRANGPPGFMATIGIRVPLQWGLRQAQAREASARIGAAQSRREASLLDIQGELSEALAGLEATRQTEVLLTTTLKPQTEAAYRSALSTYQLSRGDLTAVLEAAHHVQEVQLELLKVRAEQQMLIAVIERAVGGDL
jgi:cobalt-zinc-cadmium efflux system outer membrane protein